MKKLLWFIKKCKKGFTLMECVCAIAVVGLLSALILPLTAGAIRAMKASDALRSAASEASQKNASVTTDKNNTATSETVYVTVSYGIGLKAESAFVFTKTSAENTGYDVRVTYYDLKYGKETEDVKK